MTQTLDRGAVAGAQPEGRSRIAALDGIRGLAVLAVMLFHTDSQWLDAGYLGVDVFFVLSGFLISDILQRGLRNVGTRTVLSGFWLRRARRLAPALLLLVAFVALLRIVDPTPGNYAAAPIWAALTYTTNWYEILTGGDYFEQFASPSLLLHTWSLAIEEQFYLAFPLVMVLAIPLAGRRSRRLGVILAGLAGASAMWTAWLAVHGASVQRIYMGTDTRVQSLLVGAALGVVVGCRVRRPDPSRRSVLLGVTAILLLGAFAMMSSLEFLFRGGFLMVAVATSALIYSALGDNGVARTLALRPLAGLGVISYSVYLWHFPIFALIQGRTAQVAPLGAQLWSFVLTVLVAAASYRVVERPFLTGGFTRLPHGRQWLTYGLSAALIAALALAPAGAANRDSDLEWPPESEMPRSVLMMGDSTAFGLDLFFPHDRYPDIRTGGTWKFGCGFSATSYRNSYGVMPVDRCQDWVENTRAYVAQNAPEVVVIQDHTWSLFDRVVDGVDAPPGTAGFDEDFTRTLRQAIEIGGRSGQARVYVIKLGCQLNERESRVLEDQSRISAVNNLVDQVVATSPNATAVDSAALTCRGGKPVERVADPGIREDGVHWSRHGAEKMWNVLAQVMASDRRVE